MRLVRPSLSVALIAAVLALGVAGAGAQDEPTPELISEGGTAEAPPRGDVAAYSQYLVHRAIERYVAEGRDATVEHYSDPATVDGQWYAIVADADGTIIAHPLNEDLIGVDTEDLVDVNGKAFGEEIELAGTSGAWVDFYNVDPTDGETKRKHLWVIRYDDLMFGSGWYTVPEPPSDDTMAGETGPVEDTATG